jgi:hypothetical protein
MPRRKPQNVRVSCGFCGKRFTTSQDAKDLSPALWCLECSDEIARIAQEEFEEEEGIR